MIDEVKPISRNWLVDRVRFGERYLRYNVDDIANTKSFSALQDIKIILDQENQSNEIQRKGKDTEKDADESPYDNLSVSKDMPHDIDKLI